jgi:RNA-dependent RNA polymerase
VDTPTKRKDSTADDNCLGREQISGEVRDADDINMSAGLLARIRRALTHGLKVAGRHYVWLAAGTSQAR